MRGTTRFAGLAAVEAWDREFRWRDASGVLRDRTVESTWERVAGALVAVEADAASVWRSRFIEAFARWRVLPDEALLRDAGTDRCLGVPAEPAAVLNAAAFVAGHGAQPSLQLDALAAHAGLAVRMLDNAVLQGAPDGPPETVSIGLIGVDSALAQLGLAYDSVAAGRVASRLARALACGAWSASAALARERGMRVPAGQAVHRMAAALRASYPALLPGDASMSGFRFAALTAIRPHPLLAQMAGAISDALDPAARGGQRPADVSAHWQATCRLLSAQLSLRCHVQPWIDAPIDYPVHQGPCDSPAIEPPAPSGARPSALRTGS